MISKRHVKKFCAEGQIHLIENYKEAINDKTQTWDCHHRREIDENKSKQQLIDEDLYYDRPAEELIFLPHKEHTALHNKGNQNCKGKILSNEHKSKISESMLGKNKGKPRKKYKWLTQEGEIIEMCKTNVKRYHPDWQLIGE